MAARVIDLNIPDVPPSLNMLMRMHWSKRKKLIDLWHRWIWVACSQAGVRTRDPLPFAKVTVECRRKRALDPDNLYASAKPVLDGLRAHGLILDDSPSHITLTVTQSKGEPQTRVHIEAA